MKNKTNRLFSLISLLLILMGAQGLAQEELVTYLNASEPVISEMQSNIRDFLDEVQPLREQKDIAGVKKVADKYILIWDGQLAELAQITPPAEAETHYQALKRLLELQKESNEIMSQTLAQRLALLMEIRKMKEAGAGEDEIKEFLATNTLDKESLMERAGAVATATREADETLKSEHQRLRGMVPQDGAGDTEEES